MALFALNANGKKILISLADCAQLDLVHENVTPIDETVTMNIYHERTWPNGLFLVDGGNEFWPSLCVQPFDYQIMQQQHWHWCFMNALVRRDELPERAKFIWEGRFTKMHGNVTGYDYLLIASHGKSKAIGCVFSLIPDNTVQTEIAPYGVPLVEFEQRDNTWGKWISHFRPMFADADAARRKWFAL